MISVNGNNKPNRALSALCAAPSFASGCLSSETPNGVVSRSGSASEGAETVDETSGVGPTSGTGSCGGD